MSRLWLLALIPIVFMLSCSGGTDPVETPPEPPLAEVSIGPEGGTLEIDDFILNVPAGAFLGDQNLVLRLSDEDNFEDAEGQSRVFELSGLPSVLSEELEVQVGVDYSGDLDPELVLGIDSFSKPRGENTLGWQPIDAERVGDFVVGTIPIYDTGSRPDFTTTIRSYHNDSRLSGHEYFRVHFHNNGSSSVNNAVALGNELDSAYLRFSAIGFSYEDRTRWPVHVYISPLDENTQGETYGSIFGDNYGYIVISTRVFDTYQDIAVTAGHEFFHLVQAFYDPRSSWDRATKASLHYWLDEATAVWSEGLATTQDDYVSSSRSGNVMEPYEGLQAGLGDKPDWHGYGVSAVIKHLADWHGNESTLYAYQRIDAGDHPVRALEVCSDDDISNWWNKCLDEYFLGQLYGVEEIPIMTANSLGSWVVAAVDDTIMEFTHDFPTLSGGIYNVFLNYAEMESGAEAVFTRMGPGPGSINVYRYSTTWNAALLGSDPNTVRVEGIKSIMDADEDLVVIVSNARDEAHEYVDASTITTEMKIRPGTPILSALKRSYRISYSANLIGGQHYFQRVHPDDGTSTIGPLNNLPNGNIVSMPGSPWDGIYVDLDFIGTSFTAEINEGGPEDYYYTFAGTLNETGTRLLNLECRASQEIITQVGDQVLLDTVEWSFTLESVI